MIVRTCLLQPGKPSHFVSDIGKLGLAFVPRVSVAFTEIRTEMCLYSGRHNMMWKADHSLRNLLFY